MIETFAALAEPNRFRIVEMLKGGPRPVGTLASGLGLNQPQVSKHLAVLKKARLVAVQVQAQQRLYRLAPEGLREVDAWLEPYRQLWAARFDQLDAVVSDMVRDEALDQERKSHDSQ